MQRWPGWAGACALAVVVTLALTSCSGSRSEDLGCTDISECSAGSACIDGFCTMVSDAKVSASAMAAGADVSVLVIDAQGNSCEASVCKDLPYGSQVTFRAGEAAGFRFTGWTGSPECVASGLELVIPTLTRDTNCVANYVRRLKVTGHTSGSEAGVSATSSDPFASCSGGLCEVDLNGTVKLTAEQRFGERFAGWSGEGCGTEQTLETTIKATGTDVTCIANFIPRISIRARAMNADVVIEVSSPGAVCEPGSCILDTGGSATLTAPAVKGFRFAGWSGTAACAGSDSVLALSALSEAQLCQATYMPRVTVRGSSAGAEPPPPVTAVSTDLYASCSGAACETDKDGAVTLLASSASGYRLSGWSGDHCGAESGAAVELEDVQADLACVANYVQGIAVIGALVGAPGEVVASSSTPLANCTGGGCIIDIGGDATLSAPSVTGYRFLGWDGDPGCESASAVVSFTAVTESRTCYARFATRFAVRGSVAPTEGGSVRATSTSAGSTCTAESCTLDGGGEVELEALPSAGYRFSGWSGGGACAGADSKVRVPGVSGNVTCQANFVGRINAAAVAAPTAGGSVTAQSDSAAATCLAGGCQIDQGSRVVFSAVATPGWRFTGWSQCSDSTAPVLSLESVRTDTTCQASFTPLRYTVASAVTPAGGGAVTATATQGNPTCAGGGCTVDYDGSVALTAVPATGYDFAGWSGCQTSAQASIAVTGVRADTSCQATFARTVLTVASSAGDGGSVTASSSSPGSACTTAGCTVPYGGDVVLTATPQTGFQFGGWTGCATGNAAPLTLANVTANTSCQATFAALTFTVQGVAGPGGAITGAIGNTDCPNAACTVTFGGDASFTAVPSFGFAISGWTGCTGAANPLLAAVSGVMAPITCTVAFERINYPVDGATTGGGSIAAISNGLACPNASCSVPFGGSATFTAGPDTNAVRLIGFSGGCTPTGAGARTAIVSNVAMAATCTANFGPVSYPVTGTTVGGGSITGSTAGAACAGAACSVPFGGSATFTAGADTNAVAFTGFSGACTASAANARSAVVANVAAAAQCTANFAPVSYTVNGVTSGGGSITGSTAGAACAGASCSVPFGGSASFTAGPDSAALQFTGFTGACTAAPGDARSALVANVSGNATCTANFATVSYPVTGSTTGGGTITGSSGGAPCGGGACSVPFGGSATFTAGPDSAAIGFTGFSGACTVMGTNPRVAVVANVAAAASCVANFAGNVYTVTGNTVGGGTITGVVGGVACAAPANCSVPFGGTATFTVGADTPAISFVGFSGACSAVPGSPRSAAVSNVAAAAACTATFTGNSYTVSGTATGGGGITATSGGVACAAPATCTVPFGGSATFTATGASAAIVFAGFSGDCVPTATGAFTATVGNVSANATCVATFRTAEYRVVGTGVDPSGSLIPGAVSAISGGVTCPGAVCTVPFNGSVSFLALPTIGDFVFQRFGNGCTDTGGFTASIDPVVGAGTCTAVYGPPPTVTITVVSVPNPNGGTGTVTCGRGSDGANNNQTSCTVPPGTPVNVRATPSPGSRFNRWTGTNCPALDNEGDFNPVAPFTADADATCTATWLLSPIPIGGPILEGPFRPTPVPLE